MTAESAERQRQYPHWPAILDRLCDTAPNLPADTAPAPLPEFGPLTYQEDHEYGEDVFPPPPTPPFDPLVPAGSCQPPEVEVHSLDSFDHAGRHGTTPWDPLAVTKDQLYSQLWVGIHHIEWQKLQLERALWFCLSIIGKPASRDPVPGGPPRVSHHVALAAARRGYPDSRTWLKDRGLPPPADLPQSLVHGAYRSWPLPWYVQAMVSTSMPWAKVPTDAEEQRRQSFKRAADQAARGPPGLPAQHSVW